MRWTRSWTGVPVWTRTRTWSWPVCVCRAVTGHADSELASFGTTTAQVLALRDWLVGYGVTGVGMEATGVYWKPVFYVLEDPMECWLLNARHLRHVQGRKTDMADAAWIAQLVEHGAGAPELRYRRARSANCALSRVTAKPRSKSAIAKPSGWDKTRRMPASSSPAWPPTSLASPGGPCWHPRGRPARPARPRRPGRRTPAPQAVAAAPTRWSVSGHGILPGDGPAVHRWWPVDLTSDGRGVHQSLTVVPAEGPSGGPWEGAAPSVNHQRCEEAAWQRKGPGVKSAEEVMQILEAYDLVGSFRAAAELAGCDKNTVRDHV